MWNRRHRWIRRLAAGLAFAALVVPTAQAGIAEDTGIGVSDAYNGYGYQHGTGVPVDQQNIVRPDDRSVRISPQPADSTVGVRPDDRATRFAPQPADSTVGVRPDDRAVRFAPAPRGLGLQNPEVRPVAQPSSGFDWTDAGIGAGMAVGLMLLALGAGLATRHAGRKALAGT